MIVWWAVLMMPVGGLQPLYFGKTTRLNDHGRKIVRMQAFGDNKNPESEEEMWSKLARSELAERSQELAVGGENRVAAQYVLLLTKKHPNELVREFYSSAAPEAQAAVQEAIESLLGKLDTQWTTTAQAVAELCFKLQMTGYMLRNAEYVTALSKLLDLEDKSHISLRKAFNELDTDADGYLTLEEVEALFGRVYASSGDTSMQLKEAKNFLRFFDSDNDNLVSFDEFRTGLGGGVDPFSKDDDTAPELTPPLSGKIELVFPNGKKKKVDAKEYINDLQQEAEHLRQALAKTLTDQNKNSPQNLINSQDLSPGVSSDQRSLAKYVDSLSAEARKALTQTLTPDAQQAISQLVSFVLAGAGGDRGAIPQDAQLMMEKRVLLQLMNWQLVVGYRLRELEALDVARERAGL